MVALTSSLAVQAPASLGLSVPDLDLQPARVDLQTVFSVPPGLELPSPIVLTAEDVLGHGLPQAASTFKHCDLQKRNAELRQQLQLLQQSAAASMAAAALFDTPMGTGASRSSRRRRARRTRKLQGFVAPLLQGPGLALAGFPTATMGEMQELNSDCEARGSDESTSQGSSQELEDFSSDCASETGDMVDLTEDC
jgi:hypothetical protein